MRRTHRRGLGLLPVAVLAAENLAVFGRHYFGGWGFPWDFVGAYYAAAAYWTEAVSHGGLTAWMPFQSMGYPFLLNLQTGLFYPPMWVYPVFRIPYTLHAAVVLQCLHVLVGALGMYVLARALLRSRREALIAAFCYQLFGGFYSNAEHVDIIRAFALTPWLLWVFTPARPIARGRRAIPRRLLLAPLFVFAMAVGGYPGNFLAALFLLGVFVALILIQRRLSRDAFRWAFAAAGSVLLGLGMAAVHLAPAWIYRDELIRYHIAGGRLFRAGLGVAHLPGLVLENRGMPIDVSMTSTWVGFAVLAGICCLTKTSLRRFWPYAALAVLSAALAAGDSLPLHPLLRRLLPPLGYSRFPSSDYRGFAAMLLVLLAAAGWRDLRHRRISRAGLLLRSVPVVLFTIWSVGRVYAGERFWPDPALAFVALLAAFAALALWGSRRAAIGLVAVLAAVSFDAFRVLPRIQGWAVADLIGVCRLYSPTPARMHDAGMVVAPGILSERPGPRPARTEGDGPYRASGYLRGDYTLGDFGGPVLRAREAIRKDPISLDFMRQEWTPVLISPPPATMPGGLDVPDLRTRLRDGRADSRITQESIRVNGARYRVDTDRPVLLVENEVFFPGWTMVRENATGASEPAVRVNGLFRGWLLPEGRYGFETRFHVPRLRIFVWTTVASWVFWLAVSTRLAVRRRRARI